MLSRQHQQLKYGAVRHLEVCVSSNGADQSGTILEFRAPPKPQGPNLIPESKLNPKPCKAMTQ